MTAETAEADVRQQTHSRSPGRPRDVRCDQAIRGAALEILAADGIAGLSMEGVAARAGVGKATIYRRWSSKAALVVDALATLVDDSRPIYSGSLRDDLISWLDANRRRTSQTLAGRILPRLLAERQDYPEVLELYRDRVITPRRQRVAEVLGRGIAAGELPPDLDIELAIDLLVGPVVYRYLVCPQADVTRERVVKVVDMVLDGVRRR